MNNRYFHANRAAKEMWQSIIDALETWTIGEYKNTKMKMSEFLVVPEEVKQIFKDRLGPKLAAQIRSADERPSNVYIPMSKDARMALPPTQQERPAC